MQIYRPMLTIERMEIGVDQTNYKSYFLGKIGNKIYHKSVSEIAYFYSENKLVYMVDFEGSKFIVDYTLEELSNQHLNKTLFYRASRKYIVSISSISYLKSQLNQRLKLYLTVPVQEEITISREKAPEFKAWLDR